ncbi:uncharacterized protein LOC144243942 [Crocuta crocuta]
MGDTCEGFWKEAAFRMFLKGWRGFLELEKVQKEVQMLPPKGSPSLHRCIPESCLREPMHYHCSQIKGVPTTIPSCSCLSGWWKTGQETCSERSSHVASGKARTQAPLPTAQPARNSCSEQQKGQEWGPPMSTSPRNCLTPGTSPKAGRAEK